ncbi:MAG: fibronectin type III domain-containing protein [Patescibacteria group bacterium]
MSIKNLKKCAFIFVGIVLVFYGEKTFAAYPLGNEAVFYHFEEAATATSTNSGSGGSAYDGTFAGAASTTALVKRFGAQSASFGETGDYMKTYFASGTNPTAQSLSVSMWVYKKEASNGCPAGGDDHFFGSSGQPSGSRFYLRCTGGFWGSRFGAAAAANSTVTGVTHQGWDHIVLVFDATNDTPKLYVNNVLRATSPLVSSYTITNAFFVGGVNDTITTPGVLSSSENAGANIDEVAIYTTALSLSDITTLYKAGDLVAPVISSIATSTVSATSTTISWTTDESGSTQVEYGLTGSYGSLTTETDTTTFVTSHSATLSGLAENTLYYYRVISRDPTGATATSSQGTFTSGSMTAPGQPSALSVIPYEGRAHLTWTAATGDLTDYLVEYKLSSDGGWTTFTDGVSIATTTMVTGLVNNFAYDFRVTASNQSTPGPVSSTVSTTPVYRVTFAGSTPAHLSVITGSSVTVSASTTLPSFSFASSTQTLRLETAGGSLVSQVSTTTRYGDYNLTHLINTLADSDLSLAGNSSGMAYVGTTDTLFIVHNAAVGSNSTIDEVDKNGTLIRSITCTLCGDIESIVLLSSVASTTAGGFDHTFMIGTENNTSSAEIFRVVIYSTGTTAVNRLDYFNIGVSHAANGGLEGIAYNSTSGVFYVARELTTPALYEVTLGAGHAASAVQICSNLTLGATISDFSDLSFKNNILYALSENTNPSKLVPINITSTSTCTLVDSNENGTASSSDTGDWLTSVPVGVTDQAEGVVWDATGDVLYVLGEADFLAKYRTTAFNAQHTFTGLADGNYVLKASFTDTNGITSSSTDRLFTISNDSISPVISSIASSSITSTSATLTWGTNESTVSSVSYGTTTGYGMTATSSATSTHQVLLTGLVPETAYHFRVFAADQSSNTSLSADYTFTTSVAPDVTAPSISNIASSTTDTSVTIAWTTDENSDSQVEYGLTSSYTSSSTLDTNATTSHSVVITSLAPATVYHFRIISKDTALNLATTSDYNVTTSADSVAPVISLPSASINSGTSAIISWNTNENATSLVRYGLTATYTATTSLGVATTATHSVSLSDLKACTQYHYQILTTDAVGNSSTTTDSLFTTSGCAGGTSVQEVNTVAISNSTGDIATTTSASTGNTVVLDIPAGYSTSSSVIFQIKQVEDLAVISGTGGVSGKSIVGDQMYDLQAYLNASTSMTAFNATLTINMSYRTIDASGYDESSFKIYRYDGVSWTELPSCVVDVTQNTVTCETTYFSTFGLFGIPNSVVAPTVINSSTGGSGVMYSHVAQNLPTLTSTTSTRYVFIRDLKVGSVGDDVRLLQQFLNNSGYIVAKVGVPGSSGKETNVFGSATKAALMRFQFSQIGINRNGVVDVKTRAILNTGVFAWTPISTSGTSQFVKTLSFGNVSSDVKRLQQFLNSSGYTVSAFGAGSVGKETTLFGSATRAAVIKFQLTNGLVQTAKDKEYGKFGPQTILKINELIK